MASSVLQDSMLPWSPSPWSEHSTQNGSFRSWVRPSYCSAQSLVMGPLSPKVRVLSSQGLSGPVGFPILEVPWLHALLLVPALVFCSTLASCCSSYAQGTRSALSSETFLPLVPAWLTCPSLFNLCSRYSLNKIFQPTPGPLISLTLMYQFSSFIYLLCRSCLSANHLTTTYNSVLLTKSGQQNSNEWGTRGLMQAECKLMMERWDTSDSICLLDVRQNHHQWGERCRRLTVSSGSRKIHTI